MERKIILGKLIWFNSCPCFCQSKIHYHSIRKANDVIPFLQLCAPSRHSFSESREKKKAQLVWKKKSLSNNTTQYIARSKSLQYLCIIGKYLQIAYVLENFSAQIIEVSIHKMQINTSFTMLLGIQKESIFLRTWCSPKVDTQSIIALSIITIDSFIYSLEWLCYSVKITGRSFEMSPRNSLLLP